MKVIPVRRLQDEIDLALWELQVGAEPATVVELMLCRMRMLCQPRRAGITYRLWMRLCEWRGWR